MSENNPKTFDPAEKVERMNHIFDHVVLPLVAVVIVLSVITAVMLKPSCGKGEEPKNPQMQTETMPQPDAYLMRRVLLDDMESNRGIFELGGYTVVETEQSGLVAFLQKDECTQYFENVADSSGGRYSAVVYDKDGLSVSVRVYSEHAFLVEVSDADRSAAAVFRDDKFTTWTSGGDAGANEVLSVASADLLTGLVEEYKQNILSLVQ